MVGCKVRPNDCSRLKVAPKFGIALRPSMLVAIGWVGGAAARATSFRKCRRRFRGDGVLVSVIKGEDTLTGIKLKLDYSMKTRLLKCLGMLEKNLYSK